MWSFPFTTAAHEISERRGHLHCMGKGRTVRRGGGSAPRQQRDDRADRNNPPSDRLERYYQTQEIVSLDELKEIFSSFRTTLPTTFRVTGSRINAEDVNELIKKTHVPYLSNVVYEGEKQSPPRQLQWYPGGLAWEITVGKNVIRRSPEFKQFQSFLVHETEAGNLSRQEAVSMIPTLLLDVEPEHYVLDMCAAPGSKSAQLVEALHAKAGVQPTGFLLANDSDAKRTHMLVHQTLGRIGSPNMMVTNLDASQLPNMRTNIDGRNRILRFDRVLADVPCTGDGTLRKNPDIWRRWTPNEANSLHALQLRILLRGLQQLRPGGRLVYSTCSLNPVENEAVVSAALRTTRGNVSLMDVSDRLPPLQRRPGLTSWKVLDDTLTPVDPPEAESKEKIHRNKTLARTLWPSGEESQLNLSRCLRIYPHLQDTGGFFVAVLQKVDPVHKSNGAAAAQSYDEPLTSNLQSPTVDADHATSDGEDDVVDATGPIETPSGQADHEESTADVEPPAKRQKLEHEPSGADGQEKVSVGREFKEDPYGYVPTSNQEMKETLQYFGLAHSFDPANLLVRNARGEPLRTVYHTSTSIRAVVGSNDYRRIRLVSCGAKLFARQDSSKNGTYPCRWRLMSDSVSFVRPYMSDARVITGSVVTLRKLMDHYIPLERFADEVDLFEALKKLGNGSALLEIAPSQDEQGAIVRQTLLAPIWQAPVSIQLMLDKKEKSALSYRIFGADITTHTPLQKTQIKESDQASMDAEKEGLTDAKAENDEPPGSQLAERNADGDET